MPALLFLTSLTLTALVGAVAYTRGLADGRGQVFGPVAAGLVRIDRVADLLEAFADEPIPFALDRKPCWTVGAHDAATLAPIIAKDEA